MSARSTLPIVIDPDIMGGVPVFKGTRVPVATMFEYLADDYTMAEFLDCFPSVRGEDAKQVLIAAGEEALSHAA